MLQKRTFHHLQLANTANWPTHPHYDIIKWMQARSASKPNKSEPYVHWVTWNPKRSLRQREDKKRTFWLTKRRRNGSRITWREKPLWQETELRTQRQQISRSRKIWEVLKAWDWHPGSPDKQLTRGWMLLETVWAILHVPTMRRMGKMTKIQSRARWAKMMNPAGWWAQSRKPYSSLWSDFGRSRWSLTKWHNGDGGTWPTDSVNEIWRTAQPNWMFRQLSNCIWTMTQQILHPQHLESLRSPLISSPEYRKCRKGLLDQELVNMRLCSWRPRSSEHIASLPFDVEPGSSPIKKVTPI